MLQRRTTPRSASPTLALLALAACSGSAGEATLLVEAFSPAARGGELVSFVGVGLDENEFAPVLAPPCPLPCEVRASFSTTEDDQVEIVIELYRGTTSDTRDAHYLGTYLVTGLPALPAGEPDVSVTFRADEDGVFLHAEEASGIPVGLVRADPDPGR